MIDRLQFRAIRRALSLAGIPFGARILDVGCGTGRWLRRYQEMGFCPSGVDSTLAMLLLAKRLGVVSPLVTGEAQRLPFADATFDCVSDITVVQHIPASQQPKALAEMMRVLKPGGQLILMELIRGKGAHVFPRTPEDWIHQTTLCGAKLVEWSGQEFLLLDRAFVRCARALAVKRASHSDGVIAPLESGSRQRSFPRRIYLKALQLLALISPSAEPIFEKILPSRLATHGVFVFRK